MPYQYRHLNHSLKTRQQCVPESNDIAATVGFTRNIMNIFNSCHSLGENFNLSAVDYKKYKLNYPQGEVLSFPWHVRSVCVAMVPAARLI